MRVAKECNSLSAAGYEVHFIGWSSSGGPAHDLMPSVRKHLFLRGRPSGRRLGISAIGYVLHAYRILLALRPAAVHAVNEESTAVLAPLKSLLGFRLVCDLFDSLPLRASERGPLGRVVVRLIAQMAYGASDLIIVTDERRREHLADRADEAVVVANYPVDAGDAVARITPPTVGPVRLYVAGSLSKPRGLDSLIALLDSGADVEIEAAGWVYDDTAALFVDHPKVTYLGVLTPAESLRRAAGCDAIVALYEPSSANNVLASPNKIYDALCVGRPVIINRETMVSSWVHEHGGGELVRYGEPEDLSDAVDRLRRSRPLSRETARRLRSLYQAGYSWKQAERPLLQSYARLIGEPEGCTVA